MDTHLDTLSATRNFSLLASENSMKKPPTVDAYISTFPEDVQIRLEQIRSTIRKAVPMAEEVISYGMPGYKYKGMLVWFGGHTHHIGFYPRVSGMLAFKKELSAYKHAKGSVQFPNDQKLPLALIKQMVLFRFAENSEKKKTEVGSKKSEKKKTAVRSKK
jgi:uncharacterized protein YdhG (YjbR/CyaY superfamily)